MKKHLLIALSLLQIAIIARFNAANAQCSINTSPAWSTFRNTTLTSTTLWLSVRIKVMGQLTANGDYLLYESPKLTFSNISCSPAISNTSFPSGKIIADNTVSSPVTSFNGTMWITRVPLSYSSNEVFITGGIFNSSTGFTKLTGGTSSVSGYFYSNVTPFSYVYNYSMACYQPQFSYSSISASGQVQSVNGTYVPGTPIPVRTTLIDGGSGSGGNNYIGNKTSSLSYTTCLCTTPSAGSISGTTSFCSGTTSTLTNSTSGGTWSSSNTAVATINSSGVVSGLTAGTSTITYTVTNACGTASTSTTVTVNTVPTVASITGTTTVCKDATTNLACATAGGVWSSSNTAVAEVNSSGVVTGKGAGTASILYTVTNSCGSSRSEASVTVSVAPTVDAITGTNTVCPGSTTTFSTTTTGGSWSSSNTAVATVNASGVVTGVATGTATITYSKTNSCGLGTATRAVTVSTSSTLSDITGSDSVCLGSTLTLNNAVTGGVWSSSNTAVATISSGGVVSPVTTGLVTITYTLTNSCGSNSKTKNVRIYTVPTVDTINGVSFFCMGTTSNFTCSTAGGVWTSNNTNVATVNASGVVSGINTGAATIRYTVSNACGNTTVSKGLTINTVPTVAPVTGSDTIYTNLNGAVACVTNGGSWSSSNNSIVTVNSSGVISGVSAGSALITYTVTNACGNTEKTRAITVRNLAPTAVNDTVSTNYSMPILLHASSNDMAGSWALSPSSVSLIGATAPSPSTVGTFVNNNDGTVTFTPVATYNGVATIQYTITDAGNQTATATLVVLVSGPCVVDGDADGVPDCMDEFPTDGNRAFNNPYPATGYSSLFFEDEWPNRGDYDMNDIVVDYAINTVTNSANNVVEMDINIVLRCSGAGLHNGFAIQLDNVSPGKITSVSGTKTHNASWLDINSNGTENGQTYANIIVFDDAYKVMPYPGSGNFLNTYMTSPKVPYDTMHVHIQFINNGVVPTGGTVSMSSLSPTNFNPYIIIGDSGSFDQIRSKELHLPDKAPSSKMDAAWFGKGVDNSSPSQGRYYKTSANLPWAINVSSSLPYLQEKQDISSGYLHFIDWAQSNGSTYTDWYLNLSGYRNNTKLYTK